MVLRFILCVSLMVSFVPAFAIGPLPFEELLYKGRALPFYGETKTPQQTQILEFIKESKLAERMAQLTQGTTRLRHDLNIGFESCGNPNAFFDHNRSAIVFCVEMIELIAAQTKADTEVAAKWTREQFARNVDGVIWGIFFHELGHAVIGINRVAITGREEDVADQFAVYYAVNYVEPRNVSVVLPTIWFFNRLAKSSTIASSSQDDIKRLMADEHSLSEQRIYNLACWALGSNSKRGVFAADFVKLPKERAERCQGEYATLDYGIKARFKKYFKPQKA
ncbi:MAG: DUF4344 domain-containing metallopeptidase [Sideroxydans sp.]|nr:DUF4344 domain-containing metallopeptidase [Sideroxydans sp.]